MTASSPNASWKDVDQMLVLYVIRYTHNVLLQIFAWMCRNGVGPLRSPTKDLVRKRDYPDQIPELD